MELFWTFISFLGITVIAALSVAGAVVWICRATDSCKHTYERIDTYNDKKMILVCRKCGKIKKLNK